MSLRTIVEFNNDRLDDLRKAGHISEELWRILIRCFPDEYPHDIPGVEVKDVVHHSTDYRIQYGTHRDPK